MLAQGSAAAPEPPIGAPIAISGRIAHQKDVDTYRLKIERPTTLRIAARSKGFGSALDPLLIVQDRAGKRLKIDDDSGADRNANITTWLQAGKHYVLRIRLYLNWASGDTAVMMW